MSGALATIKQFLANDNTDSTAAVASAANITDWPTSADVPDYAWKCFGHIWYLGWQDGVTTPTDVAKTIKYKRGEETNATQEIVLLHLPVDAGTDPEGWDTNPPGARMSFDMEVVYKLPEGKEDYDLLWETAIRVRYLLDKTWRRTRKLGPIIKVSPPVDLGMTAGDGLICEWQGFVLPPNGFEMSERWHVHYEIVVPKN